MAGSYTFCVVADPESCSIVKHQVEADFGAGKHKVVLSPSKADLAAIKKESNPIILVVFGPIAVDALKDLCDDHSSPTRRVKLIYSLSAGVDSYRLAELRQELHNIPFCNAQGCFSNILAEHVIYSILHFNRFPWRLQENKMKKKWERFSMLRVEGMRMVIFGYGNIGEQCGRLAVNMGMSVTGIKRTAPAQPVDKYGVRVYAETSTDDLLREADVVLGVLPATPHTEKFFNKNVFKKMKPSALFINIGRGSTQDEDDLVQALKESTIRGAALDVFQVEPLPPSSPLWTVPDDKILLTPHCADVTDDLIQRSAQRMTGIAKELMETGKVTAYTVCMNKGY